MERPLLSQTSGSINDSPGVHPTNRRRPGLLYYCRCFRCCAYCTSLNSNVRNVLCYTFAWYSASSIFQRDLLSVLVRRISGSNQAVGLISGVQGIAQVLLAFPVGYFGDRFLRQTLLRWGIFVGLCATAVTSYIFVTLEPGASLLLFYIGFFIWGGYIVLTNPAVESLFADSVPTGERTFIFSVKFALLQIARATGPAISVGLFCRLGDSWKLVTLRKVLLIGAAIGVGAMLLLVRLRDDQSLGEEAEIHTEAETKRETEIEEEGDPVLEWPGHRDDGDFGPASEIDAPQSSASSCCCCCCCCCCYGTTASKIRWTIAFSDVFTSTAAGMTVKFFPLWFVASNDPGPLRGYDFSPINLSWLYLVMPLCTALFAMILKQAKIAGVGRPLAIVLSKAAGIAALYTMCFFDMECRRPLFMCALFVFRTAIMNSGSGMKRSILMDAVPKSQRVRWNSLESITRMTWSGSAVLGGFLVDQYGFRFCFLITAIVYSVSTTPFLLLIYLLPKLEAEREEEKDKDEDEEEG
jgi:MFS family permease